MERANYAVSLIHKEGNWRDADGFNKECLREENKDEKSVALDVKRGTGAADFFLHIFPHRFYPIYSSLVVISW